MISTSLKKKKKIRIDRYSNGITEVVLNNPNALNIWDDTLFTEIGQTFTLLGEEKETKVIIIWGEGRMFTAGLDLKTSGVFLEDGEEDEKKSEAEKNSKFRTLVKRWQRDLDVVRTINKPVIAAIHSKCIGAGVDLVSAADIRFASSDASFSIKETKLAMVADVGTLQRIERVCNKGFAREMAFTGDFFDAKDCLNHGFVNRIFEDKNALLVGARKTALSIAENSMMAVQGTKIVLNYSEEHTISDSLDYVAVWNAAFLKSHDLAEAFLAFVEKRKPSFKSNL